MSADHQRIAARIEQVRSLHEPAHIHTGAGHTEICHECGHGYPCPTIRVLDGVA